MFGFGGNRFDCPHIVLISIAPEIGWTTPKRQLIFYEMLKHVGFGANVERQMFLFNDRHILPPQNMQGLQGLKEFIHASAAGLNRKWRGGTGLGVLHHAFEELDEQGEVILSVRIESVGGPEAEGSLAG